LEYNQLRLVMSDSKCNLKCAYCIAGYSSSFDSTNDPAPFCEGKVFAAIGKDTFSSISIWGGEPFYNFPQLKVVVEFCARHYSGIPILIISNGTAFTEGKIDFINKHKLNITLSHDGVAQHYRGIDYLRDQRQLDMIQHIKQLAFTTVIHNSNCDIPAIFRYFEDVEEKLQKELYWGFELIQLPSNKVEHFMPQEEKLTLLAKSLDFLLEQFLQEHPFAVSSLYPILNKMAKILDENIPLMPRCGAQNRLTVTTLGEKAYCQVKAENGNYALPDTALPQHCQNCEVSRFCMGICPGIKAEYRVKTCPAYRLFFNKLNGFLHNMAQTKQPKLR